MAGNGNGSLLILALVCLGIGGAGGWVARGINDGSVVSAKSAAVESQSAVDSGTEADRAIVGAQSVAAEAETRVEYITKTVTVDKGCPPGRGAISAGWNDELRKLAADRAASAAADAAADADRVR